MVGKHYIDKKLMENMSVCDLEEKRRILEGQRDEMDLQNRSDERFIPEVYNAIYQQVVFDLSRVRYHIGRKSRDVSVLGMDVRVLQLSMEFLAEIHLDEGEIPF